MSPRQLTPSLRACLPSGALCSLFGPRTFSGGCPKSATGSLRSRLRQVRRLPCATEHLLTPSHRYAELRTRHGRAYVHRLVMQISEAQTGAGFGFCVTAG
jgi:hypothetical protein